MIGRYRVTLATVQLDSLDDDLLILDVKYPPPKIERQRVTAADLDGYEIDSENVVERTVQITFELHIYDTERRNEVCRKVNAWANKGGNLRVSDRWDHFLNVVCDQPAEIPSVKNWTAPITIGFITTGNPYWQSVEEKSTTLAGKSAKGILKLDGDKGSVPVSVTATAEKPVTSFKAVVGDTQITLTGLTVAAGQKIVIDYLKGRYLRIRANGKSVMARMNAASSDRLMAPCGTNTQVSFTANDRMTVAFSARGVWR